MRRDGLVHRHGRGPPEGELQPSLQVRQMIRQTLAARPADHIAKELIEVRDSDGDLKEWVDVVTLGLDGCWRSGATPEEIVAAIAAKQTKNENRTWPDWRTVAPDTAIEHVRKENENG